MDTISKEEKLDYFLLLLEQKWENNFEYRNSSTSGNTADEIYEYFVSLDIETSIEEIMEFELRLILDGYIEYVNKTFRLFKPTGKGLLFIKDMGYKRKLEIQNIILMAGIKTNKKNNKIIPVSFTYKNLATNPEAINIAFDDLKKGHIECSIIDFRKVFSGKSPENKIVWKGDVSELYYFFKLLYTKFKVLEDLKQQQWKIVTKCFIFPNNEEIDYSKLRGQKKPENEEKADFIEKVAKRFR